MKHGEETILFYVRFLTNKLMAKLPVGPSSPSPACYKVHLASLVIQVVLGFSAYGLRDTAAAPAGHDEQCFLTEFGGGHVAQSWQQRLSLQ